MNWSCKINCLKGGCTLKFYCMIKEWPLQGSQRKKLFVNWSPSSWNICKKPSAKKLLFPTFHYSIQIFAARYSLFSAATVSKNFDSKPVLARWQQQHIATGWCWAASRQAAARPARLSGAPLQKGGGGGRGQVAGVRIHILGDRRSWE